MADNTPVVGKGLFESLKSLAATLFAIMHTRLDLLSTELVEERAHAFSLLVWVTTTLFFIGVGVVLTTILLVVAFWDSDRLLVLGLLAGLFATMGLAAGAVALHKVRTKSRPFATSLTELYKDRLQLASRP